MGSIMRKKAINQMLDYLKSFDLSWYEGLVSLISSQLVVGFQHIADIFGPTKLGDGAARAIIFDLNLQETVELGGWFTSDRKRVGHAIRSLTDVEPVALDSLRERIEESGLSKEFLDRVRVPSVGTWIQYNQYWIRSKYSRIDKAYVSLLEIGSLTSKEIASITGDSSYRGLDNALARSCLFTRVQNGRWVLSSSVDSPVYKSALPAILDLFKESGPMSRSELIEAMSVVYPVSDARIDQCLDGFQFGLMPDGRFWLVELGAERSVQKEPNRPSNIFSEGDVVGVRIRVDADHLRGSGSVLHSWICWKFGLKASPERIYFDGVIDGLPYAISVTRNGSQASLSSIRAILESEAIREDCEIVLLFNLGKLQWTVKHVCRHI